jgi:hypothetical protein
VKGKESKMENTRHLLAIAAMSAMVYRDNTPGTDGSNAAPAVVIPEGMRAQVFHFRKEKIKDEEGKEIEVFKHPSVTIPLPVPTVEMVRDIFNAPSVGDNNRSSEQKFILDLISDGFYAQARDQINSFREDNPKGTVTADVLDYSKLTITALANMPASERGSKVSEEDVAEFIKDYVAVMPAASGKDAAKIKAQAGILEKGLRSVKTDKKVLSVMNDLLTMWAANTANLEEHQEVFDMLTGRIKKWVAAEPRNVLESIM